MAKDSTTPKKSYALPMMIALAALLAGFFFIRKAAFAPAPIEELVPPPLAPAAAEPGAEPPSSTPSISRATPPSVRDNTPLSQPGQGAESVSWAKASFIAVAVGPSDGRNGYTALFCDRGATIPVLRFQDAAGTSVFVQTPPHPHEKPSGDRPLLLTGPEATLSPWGWNPRDGWVIRTDPVSTDPFPERHMQLWDDARPATFGFAGPEAWRNGVRWSAGEVTVKGDTKAIAFTSPPDADGVSIIKRFTLYPQFKVACDIEVVPAPETAPERSIHLNVYGPAGIRRDVLKHQNAGVIALFESHRGASFHSHTETYDHVASAMNQYREELEEQGVKNPPSMIPLRRLYDRDLTDQALLNGVSDGYFLAAIGVDYFPTWQGFAGADLLARADLVPDEASCFPTYNFPPFTLKPGTVEARRVVLYAGPRDPKAVIAAFSAGRDHAAPEAKGMSWDEMVTSGWPAVLSTPITALLRWLRDVLGKTGLAIIALTLIVRLFLAPISIKAQKAMQVYGYKMREIKPRLDVLREKYKGNKSRDAQMAMFQEQRALMKANNVSMFPLGGCLPMLLQFPIFIALYNSVRTSFLLRHETFLWMEDLSRPDALFGAWQSTMPVLSANGFLSFNLLPVVWAVLMVVQQMLAPKPSDPQQAKMQKQMMFIMPLMGVFFYAMPSGFVLYFVASSIYTFFETRLVKVYLHKKGIIPADPPRNPPPRP